MPPGSSVLVVDDEKDIRDMLRLALVANGYEVRMAADGREAVASISRQAPSVVILDLMMPRMSGYEVIASLREDGRLIQLPVIILTGRHLDESDSDRLAGACAIFQKGALDVFDLVGQIGGLVAPQPAV